MNCPTCGAGLIPDAKFCGACGTPNPHDAAQQPQPQQQQQQ
jgi:predicted amidophosphoribosyltransferase